MGMKANKHCVFDVAFANKIYGNYLLLSPLNLPKLGGSTSNGTKYS